jgi:hypothetical protein
VVTIGSLLHFAWAWSGRSTALAVFAAMNESTWEHLKLAFWPALLLSPIQRWSYGKPPGWLPGTAIRCLLPSVLIVVLFYGYTSALGAHYLAADLATFVVAIFVGELLGHRVLLRRTPSAVKIAAAGVLLISVVAFSTLSFIRPSCFLFAEPAAGDRMQQRQSFVGAPFIS